MIDDKQAETLAQTLPSRVNKRGIKVSEWVLWRYRTCEHLVIAVDT